MVLDGYEPGGQLALTTLVENFPGFPDGILGPELIENTRKQAQRFGAEFRSGAVTGVDLSTRPIKVTVGNETFESETLIVAAGASARMLGIESEKLLLGYGVSTCATCDGFFFRGKDILVVGGGDTAMEEATFLTKFASKVSIVHRRNEFRASKIMIDRARANPKIEFLTPYEIAEVHDVTKQSVERSRSATPSPAKKSTATSPAFSSLSATIPTPKFSRVSSKWTRTATCSPTKARRPNVAGVFAAGDVQDHRYRQAITAAGSGCMAALEVEKYLAEHEQ